MCFYIENTFGVENLQLFYEKMQDNKISLDNFQAI